MMRSSSLTPSSLHPGRILHLLPFHPGCPEDHKMNWVWDVKATMVEALLSCWLDGTRAQRVGCTPSSTSDTHSCHENILCEGYRIPSSRAWLTGARGWGAEPYLYCTPERLGLEQFLGACDERNALNCPSSTLSPRVFPPGPQFLSSRPPSSASELLHIDIFLCPGQQILKILG